jgi:hypothetical protein
VQTLRKFNTGNVKVLNETESDPLPSRSPLQTEGDLLIKPETETIKKQISQKMSRQNHPDLSRLALPCLM